jgi:hypothetical protein
MVHRGMGVVFKHLRGQGPPIPGGLLPSGVLGWTADDRAGWELHGEGTGKARIVAALCPLVLPGMARGPLVLLLLPVRRCQTVPLGDVPKCQGGRGGKIAAGRRLRSLLKNQIKIIIIIIMFNVQAIRKLGRNGTAIWGPARDSDSRQPNGNWSVPFPN